MAVTDLSLKLNTAKFMAIISRFVSSLANDELNQNATTMVIHGTVLTTINYANFLN